MKRLNNIKIKKGLTAIAAAISILVGSVAVYGAETETLQPVAQEVIDDSMEIAQAQAAELVDEMQKKAEEETQRKLEEAAQKAAEEARQAQRQEIVNYALQFVGNPYVYGGTSLTNGADCSGFVQSVFAHFGHELPRVAGDQAYSGTNKSLEEIEPGDLVFYGSGSINHVALYIGDGQIVHASTAATGIKVSDYDYQQPCLTASYVM